MLGVGLLRRSYLKVEGENHPGQKKLTLYIRIEVDGWLKLKIIGVFHVEGVHVEGVVQGQWGCWWNMSVYLSKQNVVLGWWNFGVSLINDVAP